HHHLLSSSLISFLLLIRRPPPPTLFPYTTLFRSLGVTAIMLLIAFRSVLVPLKAVVLNCVSVSAAFGITVLVFQHGYGASFFGLDRKSTRLNSSHDQISYAVFCLKKKKK